MVIEITKKHIIAAIVGLTVCGAWRRGGHVG